MFPRATVEVEVSIPGSDTYWVPRPSDVDEEGFGDFRGVWPIMNATTRLAASVLASERVAAAYVDAHASTPTEFEELASELENFDPTVDETEATESNLSLGDEWIGLEGLELGVAGLTYALSNAGLYPAASCRSHQRENSWSPNPVVVFAGDKPRVLLLESLVRESSCGLQADYTRGDFLFVYAPSIRETMALATRLYDSRGAFRSLPKTARKHSPRRVPRDPPAMLF